MPDPRAKDAVEAQFSPEAKAELLQKYNERFEANKKDLTREEFEYVEDLNGLMAVGTEFLQEKGFDGSIATNPVSGLVEYLAFESSQIHILGDEADAFSFKKFVEIAA